MSRALWFAAGAGAGVYAMTRARRVAEALTPEGLGDRLAALSVGARLFREEVRAGMAEKENDLRDRVGLTLHISGPEVSRTELSASQPEDPRQAHQGSDISASREGND
jgi:Family of unknown function (DUF6167)